MILSVPLWRPHLGRNANIWEPFDPIPPETRKLENRAVVPIYVTKPHIPLFNSAVWIIPVTKHCERPKKGFLLVAHVSRPLYCIVLCYVVVCYIVLYYVILYYYIILYYIILYYIILCSFYYILYYVVLYCVVFYCIVYCLILYYIILCSVVLYIILYYIILYYIILCWFCFCLTNLKVRYSCVLY